MPQDEPARDDDGLLAALRDAVGSGHVLVDATVVRGFCVDWTGRFRADARCVVRPGTPQEAAAVLQVCAQRGVAVTPQGGNTGLVGGGVPVDGGIVLSTARLAGLGPVDAVAGTVVAGSGVTLAALQAAAGAAGWAFGVDIASRDSATVGGMVATDAGGARVLLHGPMRAQVLGLEVALADGTVARPWLDAAPKDTAGYALHHLLVGSEGTLGVVTAARLRLVRPTPASATVLVGVRDAATLAATVAAARDACHAEGARLAACELVDAAGLRAAADLLGVAVPVGTPFALLLEATGGEPVTVLTSLAALGATTATRDASVVAAVDEPDRRRLWALRERQAEAVNLLGVPVKLDVAVPHAAFAELLEDAPRVAAAAVPGARTTLYGHAAEANVHVNVVLPTPAAAAPPDDADAAAVETAVLALVERLGGTVSAEHGVGREKVRHLARTRDAATITAMRALKRALDPTGVLNPGVVLPVGDADGP